MVDRLQFAVEAAPTLLLPDGEGGVTIHPVTDDGLLAAASKISEANGWPDKDRVALYAALVETMNLFPSVEPGEVGCD